jgi:hypothetical protein
MVYHLDGRQAPRADVAGTRKIARLNLDQDTILDMSKESTARSAD